MWELGKAEIAKIHELETLETAHTKFLLPIVFVLRKDDDAPILH